MLEFLNQPLNGTSSLILVVVLVAVIFIAIKLGHKKREISPSSSCQNILMPPRCIFTERISTPIVRSWSASVVLSQKFMIHGQFRVPKRKKVWPATYYLEQ